LGAGTSTAALGFGGNAPPAVANNESWNGSSWTEVNDLNQITRRGAGIGTQTSALAAAGDDGPARIANTESWNGSIWVNENTMNTNRNAMAGSGTQTSALVAGGFLPAVSGATEEWNGDGITTQTIATD